MSQMFDRQIGGVPRPVHSLKLELAMARSALTVLTRAPVAMSADCPDAADMLRVGLVAQVNRIMRGRASTSPRRQ